MPTSPASESTPPPSDRRLLGTRYDTDFYAQHLAPAPWHWFPPAADRAVWEPLLAHPANRRRLDWIVARCEAVFGQPWPALPATLYMEFARVGNRSRYEAPYFERRERIAALAVAEAMEHRGRFIDELANGIWAVCEESTWCLPAHASRAEGDSLPRLDFEDVDLFAAETAMTLATACALLGPELDHVSPVLRERVRRETLRRVVEPIETSDAYGWLEGRNNWAPWCASNVLGAAFVHVTDTARLARLCTRLGDVVDRFIDRYGADGGCDEGPAYWAEATGAMLVFLELLHARTGGKVDLYAHPKIAAMGEFIARAQIAGPWFVNFADADARTVPPPGRTYRYGERIDSPALRHLALLAQRAWQADGPLDPPFIMGGSGRQLIGPLMQLFWISPDATPTDELAQLPAATNAIWLPDLQVLFARENGSAPDRGLHIAAKGGHNAENHNHNDLGHFIVSLDGQPALIDLGRGQYVKGTFGPLRYELEFTRGRSHNAPVIDGVEQAAGEPFAAHSARCTLAPASVDLELYLENAYTSAARLRELRRAWRFDTGASTRIEVSDRLRLHEGAPEAEVRLHFYAARPATVLAPGCVAIAGTPRRLLVEFDPTGLALALEPVPLTDPWLVRNWGDTVHRLTFTTRTRDGGADYRLRFRAED